MEKLWWYAIAKKRLGPVSLEDIQTLLVAGKIGTETSVWKEGMPQWTSLSTVPELAPIRQSIPPDLPKRKPKEPLLTAGRWRRLLARFIDLYAIALPLAFVAAYLLAQNSQNFVVWVRQPGSEYLFGLACVPIALLIEGLLFPVFGTTFGKLLLDVRVLTTDLKRPSLWQYIQRQWSVYVYGLAMGIPLVNLFTMAYQSSLLRKTGSTQYDLGRFTIQARRLGVLRGIVVGAVLIALLITSAVLRAIPQSRSDVRSPTTIVRDKQFWTNNLTGQRIELPDGWMLRKQNNVDGQPIDVISIPESTTSLIIGHEVVSEKLTLSQYARALGEVIKDTMQVHFNKETLDETGNPVMYGEGSMTENPGSKMHVILYKRGRTIWRLLAIDVPFDVVQSYKIDAVLMKISKTF